MRMRNQHYSVSIQDKPTIFRSFYKWLKPGGKILITDYCKSARSPSPEFAEYIKKGGYYLHDMNAYEKVLLACAISVNIWLLFHPFGFNQNHINLSSDWQSPFLNLFQMLEDAGFDDLVAEDRTDQVLLTLWYTLLSISIFFIVVLKY